MNRFEMAQELIKNPKLKAVNSSGNRVRVENMIEDGEVWTEIVWDRNAKHVISMSVSETETWEIVQPKLKEYSFGETVYIFFEERPLARDVKSTMSDETFVTAFEDMVLCELTGTWTIVGRYE